MQPFDGYPEGGQVLLGRLRGSNARHEYGLQLQHLTGQESCGYCGVNLVEDFHRWLLLTVGHVVPVGVARRLGIPVSFSEDVINRVLCCSGCNGFKNRYETERLPRTEWTVQEFAALRDAIFTERALRIASRHDEERAFFAGKPWRVLSS